MRMYCRYDYAPQAEAIGKYETELEKLLKDRAGRIHRAQRWRFKEGVFMATADPQQAYVAAAAQKLSRHIMNFAPHEECHRPAEEAARSGTRSARERLASQGITALPAESARALNADLMQRFAHVPE